MNQFYTLVTVHNNKIIDIGYDKSGKKTVKTVGFKPTIGLENNKPSKFKNIFDQTLEIKKFENIAASRKYINENKDFLTIYGNIGAEYQYINKNYKDIKFDYSQMKVFFYDIEVVSSTGFPHPNEAKYPINSIVIKNKHDNSFFALSLKPYDKTKSILDIDPKTIRFKHCKDERDLLLTFVKILKKEQPDILCGFFSNGFDNPYVINRCYTVLSDDEVREMSILKKVSVRESEYQGKTEYHSTISGIVLLDYLELYKKYTFITRENYTLDHIANVELGEEKGKIQFDQQQFESFTDFWEGEPTVFTDEDYDDILLKKAKVRKIIRQKMNERYLTN